MALIKSPQILNNYVKIFPRIVTTPIKFWLNDKLIHIPHQIIVLTGQDKEA